MNFTYCKRISWRSQCKYSYTVQNLLYIYWNSGYCYPFFFKIWSGWDFDLKFIPGNEFHRLALHYRTFSSGYCLPPHALYRFVLPCGEISPIPHIFPLSISVQLPVQLYSFSVFHALPAALGWFPPFTMSAHTYEIGCKPYALAQWIFWHGSRLISQVVIATSKRMSVLYKTSIPLSSRKKKKKNSNVQIL